MYNISHIFSKKNTKILIAPSLSDELNYYPLPQPSFNKIIKNLHYDNIEFIPNPHIMQINEILFANINYDIIAEINHLLILHYKCYFIKEVYFLFYLIQYILMIQKKWIKC